ncbi:Nucleophile aminohydrolase [Phytophthora cactorum]|nr:Nucleophile aminohydrolase [Phytophthora cactorum]
MTKLLANHCAPFGHDASVRHRPTARPTSTSALQSSLDHHNVRNCRHPTLHDARGGAPPSRPSRRQEDPAPRPGLERRARVRRARHRHRARASGHHRPGVGRAAACEQRPGAQHHVRRERRDLQLQGAGGGPENALQVPHQVGLRGHHPALLEHGPDFVHLLRGMFSFVLYDHRKDFFLAARDHMGITPMYYGYGADGSVWFASEMKALEEGCVRFEVFPPGHVFTSDTEKCKPWYKPNWYEPGHIGQTPLDLMALREAFEASVKRRMMSDVPWGVLLSGGLDSSLVASIAVREKQKLVAQGGEWINKIHSFTIGLENSPDLKAAQEVADFLGTIHHSYTYTIQEGLDAVSKSLNTWRRTT